MTILAIANFCLAIALIMTISKVNKLDKSVTVLMRATMVQHLNGIGEILKSLKSKMESDIDEMQKRSKNTDKKPKK